VRACVCAYGRVMVLQYRYWQALALPAEAVGWDNKTILNYFACELLNKANKILAFAQGLHARLGAVSRVSCLNDSILTIIGVCHVCFCVFVYCLCTLVLRRISVDVRIMFAGLDSFNVTST